MNNSQDVALRIKQIAKEKNISIKQLLDELNLSINTVSELSKGKQISYVNFARIADYLDVSIDYLLGRTEMPEIYNNNFIIGQNNRTKTINKIGDSSSSDFVDKTTQEMMEEFQKLTFSEKTKVMCLIAELNENKK